jgi:type I restriction enzyme M protein
MLDSITKKHIDNARDILVGKVPVPQQQVELITFAMMYKFMDDMDDRAIEMGDKATYFEGEYEKYGWRKIVSQSVSAQDRFNLYSEAIYKFYGNEKLPQLFRNIFKNASLPYRDPQILTMFLREINYFSYEDSEKLGDAFEYLLSITGSQGDAGQFRTPRHIIDFIVDVVNPQKDDTVLDPACGTADFLISTYKHIVSQNTDKVPADKLIYDEKAKLLKSIYGYDISHDMVVIAEMNMFLHGFQSPKIYEYDTLTSEDKWEDRFDVILANPPFMTPKGGIQPHKRFTVQASRSEVLFVDYIMEHLKRDGRAGIIVPEGIIFQSGNSYKELRKMLIEKHLYAVVSLPAGVFQPYSGVKTSILLLDKKISNEKEDILFIKIDNDGYDLGAQRRQKEGSQLYEALELIQQYREGMEISQSKIANIVSKKAIMESSDISLVGDRYKVIKNFEAEYEMVELGEILEYEQPTKYIVENENYDNKFEIPVLTAGQTFILGKTEEKIGIFPKEKLPVIIFDDFTTSIQFVDFEFKVKSSAMKILHCNKEKANIIYVFHAMKNIKFDSSIHKRYWISEYSKIKIPLPPVEVQNKIVAELEQYQKIIDGAKIVVDNWKPRIDINPDWEMVELGDIAEIYNGSTPLKSNNEYWNNGNIHWFTIQDIREQGKIIQNNI